MCHPLMRVPFEVDDVVAMVRKVFAGRVVFHDGTEQIAPGITVHKIGGHSKGLQCVRVKTARGHVVLASDATHLYLYQHINVPAHQRRASISRDLQRRRRARRVRDDQEARRVDGSHHSRARSGGA
jgi:glyoxylase-like metal-dependent hydrolase (beta-lactamase superfamily II)